VQYVVIDSAIKQWHTHLKLRVCMETEHGHFERKL